jgi:hypothetical protein
MCITSADVRAEEEASVIALLREERLKKVESKLRAGQTLFDCGQDEDGICRLRNNRIAAFLEKKAKEEAAAYGEG